MKRVALGILLVAAVVASPGVQSSVYACDQAARAGHVKKALETTGMTVTVFDVVVPGDHARVHRFEVVCDKGLLCEALQADRHEKIGPVDSIRRTAKTAATLGRALATAFGAVVGSLVEAANEATASIV